MLARRALVTSAALALPPAAPAAARSDRLNAKTLAQSLASQGTAQPSKAGTPDFQEPERDSRVLRSGFRIRRTRNS